MYSLLILLCISLILVFLIYKFYAKIDRFIKTFLPSQRVIDIKSVMNNLDSENLNQNHDSLGN